jgi:hypothetical protein
MACCIGCGDLCEFSKIIRRTLLCRLDEGSLDHKMYVLGVGVGFVLSMPGSSATLRGQEGRLADGVLGTMDGF